jgi:hypothetical protein
MRASYRTFAMAAIALATLSVAAAQSPAVNQDALVEQDFQKRVQDYVKLRNEAEAKEPKPKPTASQHKIAHYQHEVAEEIRKERKDAKQGDIFTPQIAEVFRKLIAQSMNSPDGEAIRKSYERAEPVRHLKLQVNGAYPDGVPLPSTPPSLLLNLPHLPPEVEYRFLGRELVLRDVHANLIVDLIPDIAPRLGTVNAK